jgi:hypothetical protein
MRSGEFLVGGELGGAVSAREIKVWWEPMHPATSFALVVRGTRLSPAGDSVRYLNEGWAIGGSPATGAVGPVFYASGIRIPSPGRWLLVATSGPDWGCFVVDVR